MRIPELYYRLLMSMMVVSFSPLLCSPLCGDELTVDPPTIWKTECARQPLPPSPISLRPLQELQEAITIDLRNPLYEEGVLSSSEGGVLMAPDLRVQAKQIVYTRQLERDPPIFTVRCSGDLLISYREWILVGDSLYYDFSTQRGYITNGRTAAPPWHIGGREILLLEGGALCVMDGFLTTSETDKKDLLLLAEQIALAPDKIVHASNIQFKIHDVPLLWLPTWELDLKNLGRSPFGFKFGWGGFLGSYVSLLYRFLSWRDLEATARLDGFFGQGLGGGIETTYASSARPTEFYTRNYYAHDIALDDPTHRDRYRFQGTFYDYLWGTSIDALYDVVSDAEMAADYQTKDFELNTAERTQLTLRHQERSWLAILFTRVRVNSFQSVNQEIPSLYLHWHPIEFPYTGIIFDNTLTTSYLSYVFSKEIAHPDFAAARGAVHPRLYRPLPLGPLLVTPEAGLIGIAYSKSPHEGGAVGQALGDFGMVVESTLTKNTSLCRHLITPYLHYRYLTSPRVSSQAHYLFTIQDGWNRLNCLRFGISNRFFVHRVIRSSCLLRRPLWVDLWANAFFNTPTIPRLIPIGYLNMEWMAHERIFLANQLGWHFQKNQFDFHNTRIEWTLNPDLALSLEYRHRSRYQWRKADFYSFILEATQPEEALVLSPLSDRRDTLLLRLFCRANPDWTLKCDLRHGWNREKKQTQVVNRRHRSYFEYQIELSRLIFQQWRLAFIFEQRQAGNRYSLSFSLNPGPPPRP